MKQYFKKKPLDFKLYKNKGILIHSDCVKKEGMPLLKNNCVGLILADLPYGTTELAWDSIIDLKKLWKNYKRILKPNGAILLTASQPFTTTLISTNREEFKYCLVWIKNRGTGFVHAKNKPLKFHEDILIFSSGTTIHKSQSKNRMIYNPQGLVRLDKKIKNPSEKGRRTTAGTHANSFKGIKKYVQEYVNYPKDLLYYNLDTVDLKHPTQKPIKLFEYLIRTYSNEGEVVLDNTSGYSTTAIASILSKRKFICMEKTKEYYDLSDTRIRKRIELESRKLF